MMQGSEDCFLRTAGGLYVAWPLDVPSLWGEWAFVELVLPHKLKRTHTQYIARVVPARAMTPEEVRAVRRRPLLFWGMKVTNAPWALVVCRQAHTSQISSHFESGYIDPTRAIGV